MTPAGKELVARAAPPPTYRMVSALETLKLSQP